MAERISQKLLLSPQERFSLLSSFPSSSRRVEPTSDTQSLQLTSAQFRVLTEWEHFAILSLMNTDDFTSDCQWIAKRLGISPTPVEQAIDRLLLLKLITKSPSGRLSRSKIGLRTSDEVRDISIQKFHDQSLDLAKKSLHQHALEIRDFTATTFAIDPDKIPEAKAIIRRCQNELEELLETGRQREVYRFSTQLFPLTIFAPKTKKETPQ